ncbi:unnamed protein product [Nesidiocoris tenuis]|uniref:Uncharacterized protein n=1 Tax=Nesidiocoris tenuis TaxID=355587 RepID=A0A6H5HN75_9HEMI|nr:unnamed protein product [Nesidiocoris tenuis]
MNMKPLYRPISTDCPTQDVYFIAIRVPSVSDSKGANRTNIYANKGNQITPIIVKGIKITQNESLCNPPWKAGNVPWSFVVNCNPPWSIMKRLDEAGSGFSALSYRVPQLLRARTQSHNPVGSEQTSVFENFIRLL